MSDISLSGNLDWVLNQMFSSRDAKQCSFWLVCLKYRVESYFARAMFLLIVNLASWRWLSAAWEVTRVIFGQHNCLDSRILQVLWSCSLKTPPSINLYFNSAPKAMWELQSILLLIWCACQLCSVPNWAAILLYGISVIKHGAQA